MLISVKKRFVFIANSKSASTSIEAALGRHAEIHHGGSPARKHIGWREVRKEYAFLFDNKKYDPGTFLRFGVVRQPVDWVLSWFNYRRVNEGSDAPPTLGFERFWNDGDWVQNKQQRGRFLDDDGVCRFDLIIPMEALERALPELLAAMQINHRHLPRKNQSPVALSRPEISPALIDRINEHYRDDLAFYSDWRDRFDGAMRNALNKVARNSKRPDRHAGRKTYPGVLVERSSCDLVRTARLAPLTHGPASGSTLAVKGVVMPKAAHAPGQLRLIVSAGSEEREAEWGLDSPGLARRFPENPWAARSRFAIEGLRVERGQPVEISLVGPKGGRHVLFRLERSE